jgi:hypothetical protein
MQNSVLQITMLKKALGYFTDWVEHKLIESWLRKTIARI